MYNILHYTTVTTSNAVAVIISILSTFFVIRKGHHIIDTKYGYAIIAKLVSSSNKYTKKILYKIHSLCGYTAQNYLLKKMFFFFMNMYTFIMSNVLIIWNLRIKYIPFTPNLWFYHRIPMLLPYGKEKNKNIMCRESDLFLMIGYYVYTCMTEIHFT